MSDLEKITEGFLVLDSSGKINFCNLRAVEILGLEKKALIGSAIDVLPFVGLEKMMSGVFVNEAFEYQNPVSKKKLLLWVSNEIHYHQDGSVDYGILSVSETAKLCFDCQTQISMNVKRYELVAKATRDVVWDLDILTNQFEWVGDGIYDLLGYEKNTENKLLLSDFLKLIHEEDLQRVLDGQSALIRNRSDVYWSDEFRMLRNGNECIQVDAKGYVLRDESGTALRIVGVLRDLSTIRETEIKLREMHRNAELQASALASSNKELEQFAYSASHDLQEPLRMIISFLSKIEKKYDDVFDERGKQYLEFASDGAKRMRQIILDLLDFSRVGRTVEQKEDIDMQNLLSETKALLRKKLDAKRAVIHAESLPVIHTYVSSMQLLFQNLIDNSIKFTKKGVVPFINITWEENCDYWKFRIADNGIGIEEENFERIFQIFKQVNAKAEYPGSGIGLAVAKKIIEKIGGEIGVESTFGKGSVFYFTVPKILYC